MTNGSYYFESCNACPRTARLMSSVVIHSVFYLPISLLLLPPELHVNGSHSVFLVLDGGL